MRLFVLGATGGIGQQLLRLGLERGHQMTAFVRSPEKITERSARLNVIAGDVFNVAQLTASLRGEDCVLSAFGPTTLRSTTLRRDFGRALSASLRTSEVRRAIVVSAAFLFPHIGALGWVLTRTLFRQMAPDIAGMEQEIESGAADWTMVRPPRLTNGPANRNYRVADGKLPNGGQSISRADVAHFMILEAERPAHTNRIVGLSD